MCWDRAARGDRTYAQLPAHACWCTMCLDEPGQLSPNAALRVRILHISDLHERGPRGREHWRRQRVLGAAWERNLDEVLRGGAINLVCFTGDVADWGIAKEYEAATAFFERLLSRLGLGAERLFMVPGNHDVARAVEEDAWKALRDALARSAGAVAADVGPRQGPSARRRGQPSRAALETAGRLPSMGTRSAGPAGARSGGITAWAAGLSAHAVPGR
ncbi:metallophosphoesterase family protein [Sorangium atrum]|uniref:metallophosphoesterase family protein n=1 Tax=Sorangium atrum TaxID=2995308 RepID=UPI00358DA0CF